MAWTRPDVERSDARSIAIVFALLGWVAVLVVASGRGSNESDWFGIPNLTGVLAATLVVAALGGLLFIIIFRPTIKGGLGNRAAFSLRSMIAMAVIVLVAVLLYNDDPDDSPPRPESTEPVGGAPAELSETAPTESTVNRTDVFTLVLLAAAAAAVLRLSATRGTPDMPVIEVPADAPAPIDPLLQDAVDEATEFLMHGADPREAVMAAYATLEGVLALQGRGRAASQTPTEHLRVVLGLIPALEAPAVELGRLYELARFSDTTITSTDQESAATALDHARVELKTPSLGTL
ncbi:MAG: DUF4129 domain-containing protein [Acidimicrobiales bacterium]